MAEDAVAAELLGEVHPVESTRDEPRVPDYEAVKSRLLAAAERASLHVYAIDETLSLGSLDRNLSFCAVPRGWEPPHERRAQVRVFYDAAWTVVSREGGSGEEDDEDDEDDDAFTTLEVEIEYHLVGAGSSMELRGLEDYVTPLAKKINDALGGEERQVYYAVASGRLGVPHVVEVKIDDLQVTSVLADVCDVSFMKDVSRALHAVGRSPERG